jgi:hypothetical protein
MNKLGLGSKSILAIVTASFCLSSAVDAKVGTNQLFEQVTINPSEKTQLIAQSRNYCNPQESVFFFAETKDFWVNICGGDTPLHYVGVSKRNVQNSIRLRLSNYSNGGTYYKARNGNVTYEIIRNTAKGSFLLVTRGNRQLVRQPLLYWE